MNPRSQAPAWERRSRSSASSQFPGREAELRAVRSQAELGNEVLLVTRCCASHPTSVHPVLAPQSGHLAEILEVTSYQRGTMSQGDGGDKQVSAADFLEPFVST